MILTMTLTNWNHPEKTPLCKALALIHHDFRPNKIVAWKPNWPRTAVKIDALIPLLVGKEARSEKNGVTTYICQDFTCQEPCVGVEALRAALRA